MDVAAEARTEPSEQIENGTQVTETPAETKEEKNVEITEQPDLSPGRASILPNGLIVMA